MPGLHVRRLGDRERPEAVFDHLLAAGLALYGVLHVWAGLLAEEGSAGGPRWLNTVVVLGTTVPLARRRRSPLAVLAIIMAALSLPQLFASPMVSGYAELLPALIASYTVARSLPGRRVLTGVAIALAGIAVLMAGDKDFRSVNELSFEAVVWSVAWLLGWAIQVREHRASVFKGRAAHLERDRDARARAAVLDERARIARELHDVVAHGVSLMVVQAGAARLLLPEDGQDPQLREPLQAIERIGRGALAEMRRLLAVLRQDDDVMLEPLPGLAQLDRLVGETADTGLPVELRIEGATGPLPAGVDLTAFRIVQEALTNAVRHAPGAPAQVTVRYLPSALELEVLNGRGLAAANGTAGAGHGLVGMRERVALYGGEIQTGPRPEGGYAVRATLPIGEDDW